MLLSKKSNTFSFSKGIDDSIKKLNTGRIRGWMIGSSEEIFPILNTSSNMSMSQSENKNIYVIWRKEKPKSLKVLFNPERYPLSYYHHPGGAAI